ncbi:MAG: c-type cytochrome domain-containing protein, partial [Planctomycetia bacterium]
MVHSFARVWRALLGCACVIGLAGIVHGAAPEQIDFAKHVQPILAEHCAHCHGIDESTRQGGLRLDIRQNALEGGDSGEPA